jgi:thioredoxin-related protein
MRKTIYILMTVVFCLMLAGCSKQVNEYGDMTIIKYSEIFEQDELEYYVYIYRPYVNNDNNCPYCETIKSEVFAYANYARKHKQARPIYIINYNDKTTNAGMYISTGENQSLNATTYTEIKIRTVPYLMLIQRGKVTKAWDEATPIKEELNQQKAK